MRTVAAEDARNFARSNQNMGYYETSAKEDIGVKEMMEYIMEQTYQQYLIRKRKEAEEDAAPTTSLTQ